MFSITKEDLEFGGIMILMFLVVAAPITAIISTLWFGYFDPRRKHRPTWGQKRNWPLIASGIILTITVATYKLYSPYLPGYGDNGLGIGHLFFSLCYLIIIKELLGLISGYSVDKRVMFTLVANLICITLIVMFVN